MNPLGLKSKLTQTAREARGPRLAQAPFIERTLLREEVELLLAGGEVRAKPQPPAKTGEGEAMRMTQRHHRLARLLAAGAKNDEAAFQAGYQPGTVSRLKADKTFQRLIAHYERELAPTFQIVGERLADLADGSLAVLADRLEDAPDDFTTRELIEMAKLGADRSGHGPTSTQKHEVTLDYGDRMAAARERIRSAQAQVIEGEVLNAS